MFVVRTLKTSLPLVSKVYKVIEYECISCEERLERITERKRKGIVPLLWRLLRNTNRAIRQPA